MSPMERMEELVKLVTVSSEEKFSTEECPQVSLRLACQLSRQEAVGDHCLLARLVSLDTEHITWERDRVSENRLRVILRDTSSGLEFFCWLFGAYSEAFLRLEVSPSDLVVLTNPKLVKTKKRYKQILPADIFPWTVQCLSREKKTPLMCFQLVVC